MTKPKRRKYLLLTTTALGALLILFLLLFALANNDWVVINLPALPWSQDPTVPLLEARLWVVMAFPAAVGLFGVLLMLFTEKWRISRATKQLNTQISSLEDEIDRLNNLLVVAQKSDPRSTDVK